MEFLDLDFTLAECSGQDEDLQKELGLLCASSNLRRLDLYLTGSSFANKNLKDVLDGIKSNKSLESLFLGIYGCDTISDDDLEGFFETLSTNKEFKKGNIYANKG